MTQNLLLAEGRDVDHIIEAVRKIQAHSAALAKAAGNGPHSFHSFLPKRSATFAGLLEGPSKG